MACIQHLVRRVRHIWFGYMVLEIWTSLIEDAETWLMKKNTVFHLTLVQVNYISITNRKLYNNEVP